MKRSSFTTLLTALVLSCAVSGTIVCSAAETAESVPSKNETVYILANADGSAEKIIVSDQFKGLSREEAEKQMSSLSDVENVKGDDCWQGVSDSDLPLQMNITYTLDGEETSAEDLTGKSGHLVIRFDYSSQISEMVMIGESEEQIYAPFAVISGTILDNDTFSNVEVVNGKSIDDGDKTVVVAIAFPGLSEDLALEDDTFEIPSYIEISADTTNCELPSVLTVASNSVWNEIDSDQIEDMGISDLTDGINDLTDAMTQLMNGASALSDGLTSLQTSCGDLVTGISTLSDGLTTLDSNSETLNTAASQIFTALLSTAQTQISAAGIEISDLTAENYAETLDQVLEQLANAETLANETAKAQVTEAVNEQSDLVRAKVTEAVQAEVIAQVTEAVQTEVAAQVTEAVKEQVWVQILAAQGLDTDSYNSAIAAGLISEEQQAALESALEEQMSSDDIQTTIESNIEMQMDSDDVQAMISANAEQQMASDDVAAAIESNTQQQIESLIEENMASDDVQTQIASAVEQANAGIAQIQALKTQLDSVNEFITGLSTYTAGVASAAEGASTINDSMPDLTDGIDQLCEGAAALSDGLTSFNEEGIQKITDFIENDLGNVKDRLTAAINVSRSYTSYTANEDDLESKVNFIYRAN